MKTFSNSKAEDELVGGTGWSLCQVLLRELPSLDAACSSSRWQFRPSSLQRPPRPPPSIPLVVNLNVVVLVFSLYSLYTFCLLVLSSETTLFSSSISALSYSVSLDLELHFIVRNLLQFPQG